MSDFFVFWQAQWEEKQQLKVKEEKRRNKENKRQRKEASPEKKVKKSRKRKESSSESDSSESDSSESESSESENESRKKGKNDRGLKVDLKTVEKKLPQEETTSHSKPEMTHTDVTLSNRHVFMLNFQFFF